MKRKLSLFLVLVLMVSALGLSAFAQEKEVPQWFYDMLKWREERVSEAVTSGKMTQEQADIILKRIQEHKTHVEENGLPAFGEGRQYGNGMRGRSNNRANGVPFKENQNNCPFNQNEKEK